MAEKAGTEHEFLKRPLYVYDLPLELILSLHIKESSAPQHNFEDTPRLTDEEKESETESDVLYGIKKESTSCILCLATFPDVQEQRRHVKSDWHNYNLKQKLKGLTPVNEIDFEKLVGELDESLSGSESSTDSDDGIGTKETTLTALLKKQANLSTGDADQDLVSKKPKRGSGKPPLMWFSTPLLPSNTSLGIYRALFSEDEQAQESRVVEVIRKKQLSPNKPRQSEDASNGVRLPLSMTSPHIFLCMIGGGHFAAMIVSLAPQVSNRTTGAEERQATVIAHKTFHRYTTRRKQGGSQSTNDSAKGAAHSAGSSLRRYNETALETEIRSLLNGWKELIGQTQLVFVRATGSTNRRVLFGPYDGQVLRHNDSRNRSFPFSTRRATQAELMRAFVELTRVKVSSIDEAALAAAAMAEAEKTIARSKVPLTSSKLPMPKPTKDEEAALLHTSQLQALIRRSKAPAILSYLSSNSLTPDFVFKPESAHANHHASRPLHLAASTNCPAVVLALISKAGANPTIPNDEGKLAFDLAGDRATRDAFRIARSELGEEAWDWNAAHCPSALTKAEADKRGDRERLETEQAEQERRTAENERFKKESAASESTQQGKKMTGRALGAVEKTGTERREEQARGLTPEAQVRLERERRARAAEERMRRLAGGPGGGRTGR